MGHGFSQVGPQCQPCRGIWADTPGLEAVTESCSPATDRGPQKFSFVQLSWGHSDENCKQSAFAGQAIREGSGGRWP